MLRPAVAPPPVDAARDRPRHHHRRHAGRARPSQHRRRSGNSAGAGGKHRVAVIAADASAPPPAPARSCAAGWRGDGRRPCQPSMGDDGADVVVPIDARALGMQLKRIAGERFRPATTAELAVAPRMAPPRNAGPGRRSWPCRWRWTAAMAPMRWPWPVRRWPSRSPPFSVAVVAPVPAPTVPSSNRPGFAASRRRRSFHVPIGRAQAPVLVAAIEQVRSGIACGTIGMRMPRIS